MGLFANRSFHKLFSDHYLDEKNILDWHNNIRATDTKRQEKKCKTILSKTRTTSSTWLQSRKLSASSSELRRSLAKSRLLINVHGKVGQVRSDLTANTFNSNLNSRSSQIAAAKHLAMMTVPLASESSRPTKDLARVRPPKMTMATQL